MLKGRPFGGVMIMIRNNLRTVSETVFCCGRYVIVRIADCIVVNVYLTWRGLNAHNHIFCYCYRIDLTTP